MRLEHTCGQQKMFPAFIVMMQSVKSLRTRTGRFSNPNTGNLQICIPNENISRESTQAELSVNFCGIRCENPFSLLHRQWLRRSRCVAMLLMPDGQEYHIRQSVSIRAGKFLPALMRFPENIPFHSADSKSGAAVASFRRREFRDYPSFKGTLPGKGHYRFHYG